MIIRYTAEQVKRISDFVAELQIERCSDREIANRLNNERITTASGRSWTQMNVANFRNTHMGKKRYRGSKFSNATKPNSNDERALVDLIACSGLSAEKKIEMIRVCVR